MHELASNGQPRRARRQPARFRSESGPLTEAPLGSSRHVYTIYNRRFECMQIIALYAAEVEVSVVYIDPTEHAKYRWCSYAQAQKLTNYRGSRD